MSFDGVDVSGSSASTGQSDTGQYVQNFAHWDANGDVVSLAPETTYTMRVYPHGVLRAGKDNGQPFSNVVIFDDFMPKLISCDKPKAEPVDLVTVKTLASSDSNPSVGDIVTYNIVVTNNGDADATSVSLTDLLPDGITATEKNGEVTAGTYDAKSGLWTIGDLANRASATLTLQGTVDEGQGGNTIENITTAASGEQPDPTDEGNDLTETITVEDDAPPSSPAFPLGGGLANSVCEATPATNAFQDIGFRWTYNDNGGTSPNPGIDRTDLISTATPARFSGVSGRVNNFDLNLNADEIPNNYDPNVFIEYQFTTQKFTQNAELTGFGATVFEATQGHHIQAVSYTHLTLPTICSV